MRSLARMECLFVIVVALAALIVRLLVSMCVTSRT
jgi:hypothetical protein